MNENLGQTSAIQSSSELPADCRLCLQSQPYAYWGISSFQCSSQGLYICAFIISRCHTVILKYFYTVLMPLDYKLSSFSLITMQDVHHLVILRRITVGTAPTAARRTTDNHQHLVSTYMIQYHRVVLSLNIFTA